MNRHVNVKVVTDQLMKDVVREEYEAMLALPTGTPEHLAARGAFVRRQWPMLNQPGGYPLASTAVGRDDGLALYLAVAQVRIGGAGGLCSAGRHCCVARFRVQLQSAILMLGVRL
jgi:hypothetical protein